jgi:hypothetical protein
VIAFREQSGSLPSGPRPERACRQQRPTAASPSRQTRPRFFSVPASAAMITIVIISMILRPRRSPKWPKMAPPIGRAMNPTEKVASEARVPAKGSILGKNRVLKTSAAAVGRASALDPADVGPVQPALEREFLL